MKPFIPKRDARGPIIPTFLDRNADICVSAKYLYGTLCDYARDKDYCYPAKGTLAERLKVSLNTIKSWLAQLVKHGFVKILKKGRRDFFYLFCPSNEAPTKCQILTVEVSNFDTESNVFKANNIPPTPNCPRPVDNRPSLVKTRVGDFSNMNTSFEEFWKCYPKKEAKESARSLWFKFLKRGKLPSLEVFKKAVEFFFESSSWQRENGRYIPHLANFVRGQRWEDVPKERLEPRKVMPSIVLKIESPKEEGERIQRIKQENDNHTAMVESVYKSMSPFFKTPTKVNNCIAYGLLSSLIKQGITPMVNEEQTIDIVDFLKKKDGKYRCVKLNPNDCVQDKLEFSF